MLFIPVKPSIARWKRYDTQTKANALVRDECARGEHLGYIDIVPLMLADGWDARPVLFIKDGLHLSPKGYEIWTAEVNKALAK